MKAARTPASEAYRSLLAAAASVAGRVRRRLAEHGLVASRFRTLCALRQAGPLCPHDIADRLCQTRGNVTMILDDLERLGLVERRREGPNRRYVAVHLTPKGRRRAASLDSRHAKAVAEELKGLGARDLEALAALCRRLETGGRE
jgi:MarR family transcriptional regulator, 2-MHQ and catechol-resistance regulon repressor